MNKTQDISIRLVDGRFAIARIFGSKLITSNIFVDIDFYQNGHQRYSFRFGPTDQQGMLYVNYNSVEEQRLDSLSAQPADYKTELEALDNIISISIPSQNELTRAYEINKTFNQGEPDQFAESWIKSNNKFIKCLAEKTTLHQRKTSVFLKCFPV